MNIRELVYIAIMSFMLVSKDIAITPHEPSDEMYSTDM